MTRLWAHMKRLWPRWTLLPPAPFVLWTAFWLIRGEVRWEQIGLALLTVLLAYGVPATKRLYLGLLPMGLVGLFYDAMRFVKNAGLTESNVHLCDLRAAEISLFGVDFQGAPATLHDAFQAYSSPTPQLWPAAALDLICAIPYGIFIFAIIGYAVFLYVRDFSAQQRFTWAFLLLNIAGFITYHVYPAAPPWYYHAHGCVVDLAASASPGPNLLRVDARLGVPYFQGFYGRASDVFGAVPSLHVTYPLLMLIEGWRHHRVLGRTLLVAFYVSMCFSAVYLDHHWVIDVVIGTLYGVVAASALRAVWSFGRPAPVILPFEQASQQQGQEARAGR